MQEETKAVVDAIAVGGTVGTLAGWLPPLAALATIIWTFIRILETETVQKLFKKMKSRYYEQ
jgi:chromate transport protein ChrA